MPRPRLLLSAFMLVLLVPVSASAGQDDIPPYRSSANLEMVAHIPGSGGTDLEFFSRTLETYKDASGEFVTPEEPVERHFSLVGNQNSGPKVVDITDPENPFIAAPIPSCNVSQGDPQVNKEGTVAAVARHPSGTCRLADGRSVGAGSVLIDLSDPYMPTPIGHAPDSTGAHNQTMHPNGKYLYISPQAIAPNAGGGNSRMPIFDITDPARPRKVKDFVFPGNGPHDIRFSLDGTRAYIAGISAHQILDMTDPENPEVISTIVAPGDAIGHDTLVTDDKAFLFIGDEAGGGAPFPCPGGAVYVYDIRDETNPLLLGAVEAGGGPVTNRMLEEAAPGGVGSCTSHVMEMNPDRRSFTLGWYSLGTRVFDFSGLYNADGTPKPGPALAWGRFGVAVVETGWIVPDGGNTWAAKQYAKVPGYIFSDDTSAGFYVTKIKG